MRPQPTLETENKKARIPPTHVHELPRTDALRETIGKQVAQLCFQTHGQSLRAVVLTGSLARDEATLVEEGKSWRLLGDAEFLLIFHTHASLPRTVAMGFLRQNIETSISRFGVTSEICVTAAYPKYLRSLRPSIFAYELRNCGKVVWGDPEILTCIPSFSSSDIPWEDGWRLLSNRMVEQLEVLEDLEQKPKMLSSRLHYRTVKLYLDMATSFLLFAGEYAPTYEERAQRLRILADTQPADDKTPFNLHQFCDRVSECTQWKLSEIACDTASISQPIVERDSTWWEEAVGYAQVLWGWELALLTGSTGEVGNQELLKRWMNCQPVYRHFEGPGTDLTIGLLPTSTFHAARDVTVDGIEHLANLPTEEVYATPDPQRADGHVRSTKPLVLADGTIIRGLEVRFENGRVAEIDAEQGAGVMRGRAAFDDGASRLGE